MTSVFESINGTSQAPIPAPTMDPNTFFEEGTSLVEDTPKASMSLVGFKQGVIRLASPDGRKNPATGRVYYNDYLVPVPDTAEGRTAFNQAVAALHALSGGKVERGGRFIKAAIIDLTEYLDMNGERRDSTRTGGPLWGGAGRGRTQTPGQSQG